MSKKTLALISGLVVITVVLFVIALKTSNKPSQTSVTQEQSNVQPTAVMTPVHSVLSLSPNPLTVLPGQQGSVNVTLDTSDNEVTGVQLELSYDPTVISNVKVAPGPFFPNAVILIDKNDAANGKSTYAFGIQPNRPTVTGTGTVAVVTFTAKNVPGKKAEISILPNSLVSARGVANSVLKSATGTMITVGQ